VSLAAPKGEVSSVTTIRMRFPRLGDVEFKNELLIVLSDLNTLYEVTAMTTLDRYQEYLLASDMSPRWSRLQPQDRLRVASIEMKSPLQLVATVADHAAFLGVASTVSAALVVAIRFQKIVAAGLDIVERSRLMPLQERALAAQIEALELQNHKTKEQVRSLRVRADVAEALKGEILAIGAREDSVARSRQPPQEFLGRPLSELTKEEKAEVIEPIIRRIVALTGGEAEIGVRRADPPP
jgi:hypothetical protein